MEYKITKFFNDEELKVINDSLVNAVWKDGIDTTSSVGIHNMERNKKNFQTTINSNFLFDIIDTNNDFLDFTLPKYSEEPIISKTPTGGYYKPHFDYCELGHFSTTIFLNDPKTYDGGELCLYFNNTEEKIKLDPGYGIIYETGTPHRVNTVTKGERLVYIFWTTSKIPVMEDLCRYRYYIDLSKKHQIIDKIQHKCKDFADDLGVHFQEKAYKIRRKYLT